MKRGEPQRRRRNRGPRADSEAVAAPTESKAVDDVAEIQGTPAEMPEVAEVAAADATATASAPKPEVIEVEPAVSVAAEQPSPMVTEEPSPIVAEEPAVISATEEAVVAPTVATEQEAPAPAVVEAAPPPEPVTAVQEEVLVEPTSTDGITADGRACNDPRIEARPVGVVEITTTHPTLFGDSVAPPVAPSGHIAARASNDPRGPLPEDAMAEAAG
jgi:ribonuclease E